MGVGVGLGVEVGVGLGVGVGVGLHFLQCLGVRRSETAATDLSVDVPQAKRATAAVERRRNLAGVNFICLGGFFEFVFDEVKIGFAGFELDAVSKIVAAECEPDAIGVEPGFFEEIEMIATGRAEDAGPLG